MNELALPWGRGGGVARIVQLIHSLYLSWKKGYLLKQEAASSLERQSEQGSVGQPGS